MATSGLCFSAAAVLLLLAAASPQDDLEASFIRTKCQTYLTGVSAAGHSRFELSALCRARLPSHVCGSALGLLGRQPWAPSAIDATCGRWQAEFAARVSSLGPERRAQTQGSIQATLDQITAYKAQLGICTNNTLEECAQHKAREYPKATQRITDALSQMYADAMGSGGQAPPQVPQRKFQVQEVGAPAGHAREVGAPAGQGAGFWAGLAVLSAASAGLGAMLAVRLTRGGAAAILARAGGDGDTALGE